ncbi:MAG: Rrf2 family transcriptional regulator [Candidatus Omnitrophota bacterium]
MNITKKCEYAIKAMIELAINSDKGIDTTLIYDIAEHGDIPPRYLEHIMLSLKNSGILQSKRGAGGGYSLNKSAADISLGEIIKIVDGPIFDQSQSRQIKKLNESNAVSFCLNSIIRDVGDSFVNVLNSISLKDMAKKATDHMEQERNILNYAI